MRIAIVAPSPVPFEVGGAEKLWWGILEFINKHTAHQCELIKIPTKENSFWDLIESYFKFYKLDLSYFDMVISTKYPAWMVQHHNHHIYLQHCLRGLYDTYHLTNLPLELSTDNKSIVNIINLITNDVCIDIVFNAIFELKSDQSVPSFVYDFPGPFIRQLLHFFDNKAMQRVKKFSAISNTVINRKNYYPNNIKINRIYHPSNLTDFNNASYSYFFTASRLDSAKRIEMIVCAYIKAETDIPLKIAGTGPLYNKLLAQTKHDPRIEILGFISDDDLMIHYSHAYAVLFVPFYEDYGLITIEAMMCEKPVLTFNDTGGVVEFVEDKVTGLVCEPSIDKLSENIDFISSNPDLCMKMGKEAKKKVQSITWKNTIDTLLNEPFGVQTETPKKITVVTTYPIYPPRGGGQNRIYYLYKELAKSMSVNIVCLAHENDEYKKCEIAPNLVEIKVPKTRQHAEKEWKIEEQAGIPATDIAMLFLYNETPLFVSEVKNSCIDSEAVIISQPYTYFLIKEHIDKPIIYESHNVEYYLKSQMLKNTPYNLKLLKKLFEAEMGACLNAQFTTICALDDAKTMEKLYKFNAEKAVLVPNGVDLSTVPYISKKERTHLKASLHVENQLIILFIGSWHQPNIDAVEEIFKFSKKLPQCIFIILGSVGNYFATKDKPINVGFTGITSDAEKEMYLSIADVAINPMLTGSGTNLKMLDYMANGIPVLSTQIGARGLNIPDGYIAVCDINEFDRHILEINKYVDIEKCRKYVETNYSWPSIQYSLKVALAKKI